MTSFVRGGSGITGGSSTSGGGKSSISPGSTPNNPQVKSEVQFGRDGKSIPEGFHMPAFGIEDIDRAVFQLFDNQISMEVTYQGNTSKVPVIFASGERFALTRRDSPLRDDNNCLILPVISILRQNIDFSPLQNGYGTPIAYVDQAGGYYVKKRLAEADRDYQNIINKMSLKNQDNVANRSNFIDDRIFPGADAMPDTIASRRNLGNLSYMDKIGKVGIESNLDNNVFEIIQLMYPTFINIKYNITFWTQYIQQANQIMETLLTQFNQRNEIPVTTRDGYELVVFFDPSFGSNTNFEDFSDTERIIKYSFDITVPGYILANQPEGVSSPFKSFYSAPQIDFGYYSSHNQVVQQIPESLGKKDPNKFILNDTESMAQMDDSILERGQSSAEVAVLVEDPFSNKKDIKYGKVKLRNQRAGETVVGPAIVKKIDNQSE